MKRGPSLLVLAGLVSCSEFDVPFACRNHDQCVKAQATGVCEPTGSCSFSDAACPSRRRYAELASPELADQCVPEPEHVALGDRQSCAVLVGGELRCWGLIQNTLSDAVRTLGSSTDTMVAFHLEAVSDVDLAEEHACAIAGGQVWCWGSNENLRLGIEGADWGGPYEVRGATDSGAAKSVAVGRRHSCALERGGVRCWGDNSEGQLGRPTRGDALAPGDTASTLEDVVQIDAGEDHTCGQPAWGLLNCWGANDFGQVAAPLDVPFADQPHELSFYALDFALGGSHTCAINTSGEVLCWGNNALGQLGREPDPGSPPETQLSPTPLRVAKDGRADWMQATRVACGWAHSCAILADGSVVCWGDNREGQLGPKSAFAPGVSTPVVVELPERAIEISAGRSHTCARTVDGLTWCWGNNDRGQLGNGSATDSELPDAHVSAGLATP